MPEVLTDYDEFLTRLQLLVSKHPALMINTLSNVFTMRLIGNKTHGDLAEVAIAEFINQFMYDYAAKHVGKDLFRAKTHEEDILITSLVHSCDIPVSLKAYGDGPLQLSTDKKGSLFLLLSSSNLKRISDPAVIQVILASDAFDEVRHLNVLPLIYREASMECNIMVFEFGKAIRDIATIELEGADSGRGRKHPVWRFLNVDGDYIAEVRYGGASANALQRGFWTHTRNAETYFKSITDGWVSYAHNMVLVDLFAKALNSTQAGHQAALDIIEQDLVSLKRDQGMPT